MRKKKMLISIALIVIMLLNCIAPMLQAQAATAKTTMSFNSDLYKGLKSYFQEQGINAVYNDGLHTIKMENAVIAGIEELSLKEKGISDITGLDVFTGVKSLILSANNLDENSNLSVLNNFANLSYLDISSNQISDISEIQSLVERLISLDSNAINLSGQIVKSVVDISLDSENEETEVECSLPQILQMAGIVNSGDITNKGILKADWVSSKQYTKSSASYSAPYIINSSIPNPVSSTNNKFKLSVGDDSSESYTQYEGLVKWVISIKDTTSTSYNVNPSSRNILKDSIFTLYFVVHSDSSEGVIFKDNNLYTAVKEQLTKNQTINSDLVSYKYTSDQNGDIYYDVCDVTLSGTTATLKIDNTTVYTILNFNPSGYDNKAIIRKGTTSTRYEIQDYDVEYVDTYNESGVLTRTLKVKVPHYNSDARNLYIDSYNEPYALVISDLDLINKITSLILNDKRISDLAGLEKFIGLESNLNVSYNYIDTLANIYALQLNKEANDAKLQEAYKAKVSAMATTKSDIQTAYTKVDTTYKAIKEEIIKTAKTILEADSLDSTAENYAEELTKYANKVLESNKVIEGDGTSENPGLIGTLNKALNDASEGLNPKLSKLYSRLEAMYDVYNQEYKLTSLLTPELNYQTEEEYDAFLEKIKTRDGAKELVMAEVSRISTLESANALSQLEKALIIEALGLSTSSEEANPISKALNDYVKDLEETNASRSSWTAIIDNMIEVDIYAQAENYCLLERMNNDTARGVCYAEEYLEQKIEDFEYEGINTNLLTAIYEKLSTGTTSLSYNTRLYNIFSSYRLSIRTCESETAMFCRGKYYQVESLDYTTTSRTDTIGTAITHICMINLFENLDTAGTNSQDIYFYNQLMSLANKFTALDEVSRYVVLPILKKIDVRNNEIETLGDTLVTMVGEDGTKTTTTETLSTLKNLKEFYAGHNIVTGDIACVDWSSMTTLKKLDLSYNYMTDISPLQVLTNLRYLDVSDNLLEGAFNLSLKEMPKLKDIILAGNKYTDISKILTDYEMDAEGDFTKYFAREDTLNIDLSRQELELEIEDPIAYDSSSSVYAVELPPIFAQLEFIDATRTAYGTTSSKGTITAKGGIAYVPISKNGEFAGIVEVIAANGYPEDVTTSFGIGTKCTIKYSVVSINVNSVTINEDVTRMEKGTSATFTATVNGENVPDTTVEWDISGNTSVNTTITSEGVLTIASDETADEITIIATSNYDDSVETSKTISLYTKEVTNVTISGQDTVKTGATATYTAVVDGNNLEDMEKTVTWSVSGNTSAETKITAEGVLSVGVDETAEKIIVKAIANFDNEKNGEYEVTINRKEITSIKVYEQSTTIILDGREKTYSFTEVVEGKYLDPEDKSVTWSIEGNTSENTIITEAGMLIVAEDETADKITVIATSNFDSTKNGTATVVISKKAVTSVTVNEQDITVKKGKTATFTAIVNGNSLEDKEKTVTWSVSGNTSAETKITEKGVLTVAADETATTLTVTATSTYDTTQTGTSKVTVPEDIALPQLGYTLDSDDDIVGVSPDTASQTFKAKLVSDNTYTVSVKRNGTEIANTASVATGDIVTISKDGKVVASLEVVVKGDVNGDGTVDISDTMLVKAHRAKLSTLTGVFFKAGDVDNDGEISISDVRLILAHRARIEGYTL